MKPAHCPAGAVQDLLVDQRELLHSSSVFSELNVGEISLDRLLVGSCAFNHNLIRMRRVFPVNFLQKFHTRGKTKMTAAINAYTTTLAAIFRNVYVQKNKHVTCSRLVTKNKMES